ncbi:MAG: UPF0280 family protein [Burkholderiales bacterium]|nr:UPF0280 family protein [Burkholderiales bacterium]
MTLAAISFTARGTRGAWGGPQGRMLDATRAHFHHGPIDLVIGLDGGLAARRAAFAAAWERFDGLLEELVAELPSLRSPAERAGGVRGPVARRMVAACRPHLPAFITPMAAVAGAVADEILAEIARVPGLARAYVNNGGDIALALAPGERLRVGTLADVERASRHGHGFALDGEFAVSASDPVRGVATSGWRGRSLSLGIADSVTVLAADAASADAAATMVANAVNVEHPAIERAPAASVADDTDLGSRLVTRRVGALDAASVEAALAKGAAAARALVARGVIWGAVLSLAGRHRVEGGLAALPETMAWGA